MNKALLIFFSGLYFLLVAPLASHPLFQSTSLYSAYGWLPTCCGMKSQEIAQTSTFEETYIQGL